MTGGRYEPSEEDPFAPEPDPTDLPCDSCGRIYHDWQGSLVDIDKKLWYCFRCQEEEEEEP